MNTITDHELSEIANDWAKEIPYENVGIRTAFAAGYRLAEKQTNETNSEPVKCAIPDVSSSLPLIDIEEIKGLKDSLHKTGYTTYNHTRGGLRFINDLLDKLIMFHGNDR